MSDLARYLFLAASVGNLALANIVIFRARRARGALPIALLCVSLFVWDVAEGLKPDAGGSPWHTIRLVGSSMAPSFLWHFVLVFTGRRERLRTALVAVYLLSGLFAALTAASLAHGGLAGLVAGKAWNLAYLGLLFPFLAASFHLVFARRREVETRVERNAANLVAFGIAVGAATGFTELVHVLWPAVPRLGHLGSAFCTGVLAVAILRHRLLDHQAPVRRVFLALLVAASAVVVAVVISRTLPDAWDPYLVAAVVGLVTALAVWRMAFVRLYEQAERRKRLALVGTMAAGVAHEIRNPLAAIKGAAQFVQKDLEGTDKAEARDYLKLLVGEVDRLNGVVESFLTYARPLEPRRQDVGLEALLRDVLRLQAASLPAGIRVETGFDPDLPSVPVDPALVTQAVTNVVRNAAEAMEGNGTLTVRTRRVATALRSWAAVEISDTGPGIPASERERIFQPFYTTKAKGTGLGLAITQRIVEAHGGEISVESGEPRGCRIAFLFPLPVL